MKKPKSSKYDGLCARRSMGESNLNCYKCVQKTSQPQKLPRHPRSVLKASSAGTQGSLVFQRGSDGNKPQG